MPCHHWSFSNRKKTLGSFKSDSMLLQEIVDRMLEDEAVLLTMSKQSFLDNCKLPAGIQLSVSAAHTKSDLLQVIQPLKSMAEVVLERK